MSALPAAYDKTVVYCSDSSISDQQTPWRQPVQTGLEDVSPQASRSVPSRPGAGADRDNLIAFHICCVLTTIYAIGLKNY